MSETHSEIPSAASASASVKIIAIAVLFGCIYYASSVVITLICSILIASVLDPGVRMMETLSHSALVGLAHHGAADADRRVPGYLRDLRSRPGLL